jgi:hypothetical protein
MVDSSMGCLGRALCSEAATTPSTCLEHLLGFGRKLQQQQAAATPQPLLSASPPLHQAPHGRGSRDARHGEKAARRAASGEPFGEPGLLLSTLVCGIRSRAFSRAAAPPSGVHLLAVAGPWCWDTCDASPLTTGSVAGLIAKVRYFARHDWTAG